MINLNITWEVNQRGYTRYLLPNYLPPSNPVYAGLERNQALKSGWHGLEMQLCHVSAVCIWQVISL